MLAAEARRGHLARNIVRHPPQLNARTLDEHSSAESQQRGLRRRARSKRHRQRTLPFLLPPVRENAFDQLRLLDARDHFKPPAAARALLNLYPEYPLQPPRPVQRHVLRRHPLRRSATRLRPSPRRRDRRAQHRGTVKDPVVVDAMPKNIFDDAALKAIARWRYNPKVENGVAVERVGVQTIIRFQLEQ